MRLAVFTILFVVSVVHYGPSFIGLCLGFGLASVFAAIAWHLATNQVLRP